MNRWSGRSLPAPAGWSRNGRSTGRDVLAVAGTAAIACEEELAPAPQHRYSRFGKRGRSREKRLGTLEYRRMIGV